MVHFGVVLVLNLMIGQVTPPFGVCLFIVSDVGKLQLDRLYRAILPFLVPLIVVLLLCTYIPGIVTWLPELFFK
jgi:TRAP-type C4-dicarboxylate transport system permease large subunit